MAAPSLVTASFAVQSGGSHESLVVTLVGGFVALMVLAAVVSAVSKRVHSPYSVALVVTGLIVGELSDQIGFLAPIGELEVTPEIVLFVFLPTLLFETAFHLDARTLRQSLAPTLTLAVPGLLVSTAVIGAVIHSAAPWVGLELSWPVALLVGSILSATDPVAVIAVFRQLGAPKRLTVLVEGESLFNDATAIVLSGIILGVLTAGTLSVDVILGGVVDFVMVFLGGLAVGTVLALLAGMVIGRAFRDHFIEITTTTILAYFSFFVAEHTLGVSGVMAVVAAGLVIGGWGRAKISPSVSGYLEHFWSYLAQVANALIFLLIGLAVDLGALMEALPILGWVVLAMLVSRAVIVYALVPVVGKLPGSEPIDRRYQTVMFWGGLRGAIALAIALSIPDSVADRELIITVTTGAVLFTLLAQGLTIEGVVRHFELHLPSLADRVARLEGLIAAKTSTMEEIPILRSGGLFAPRVIEELEADTREDLDRLRTELEELREEELDAEEERRLLQLRCLAEEKAFYFRMLSHGHLSEGSYRTLAHSIELQADSMRHRGRNPDFTVHPPARERVRVRISKVLEPVPVLRSVSERLRATAAVRDYEMAWARFHGDGRVLDDLEALGVAMEIRPEIVDEIRSSYETWRDSARSRLDLISEDYPEFVSRTQLRLARRLAVHAERAVIEHEARMGALPSGIAEGIVEDLSDELRSLSDVGGSELTADPGELLKKVSIFEDLPPEEFDRMAVRLTRRTAPVGYEIVRQGERGNSLFIIARGVVRIFRNEDGEEHELATLIAGDFFGEIALLLGGRRTATCRAVVPSVVYELKREDVDAAFAQRPEIREALEETARRRQAEQDRLRSEDASDYSPGPGD